MLFSIETCTAFRSVTQKSAPGDIHVCRYWGGVNYIFTQVSLLIVQELFSVLEKIMRNEISKMFTACECSLKLEKSLLYLYFGKGGGGLLLISVSY